MQACIVRRSIFDKENLKRLSSSRSCPSSELTLQIIFFLSFRKRSSWRRLESADYSLAKCLGSWNQPDSFPREVRIIFPHWGCLYLLVTCQLVIIEDLKKNFRLLDFFLFFWFILRTVSPHLIIVSDVFQWDPGIN